MTTSDAFPEPSAESARAANAWPMTLAKSLSNGPGVKSSWIRPTIGAEPATRDSRSVMRFFPPYAVGSSPAASAKDAAFAIEPANV